MDHCQCYNLYNGFIIHIYTLVYQTNTKKVTMANIGREKVIDLYSA